ncbi:MAG: LysR substrate-binding domain-containing protein [Pseudomonadota bacterium]
MRLYAHRNYLAEHGTPLKVTDLARHRLIGLDRCSVYADWLSYIGMPLSTSNFAFRRDNFPAHVEAIRAALGIGLMHQSLARRFVNVQQVLPGAPPPRLSLWLVCHSGVQFYKRIRLLINFLAEHLKHPYGSDT